MQGQQQADERNYQIEQDRLNRERQRQLDERSQVMMDAQLQAMREASERAAADRTRQGEMDQRNAYESGYRGTEDAQRMGDALAPLKAASALPNMQILGGLGNYGEAVQQDARKPAITVGGRGMSRVAESDNDRAARIAAQQRAGERMEDRQYSTQRDERNFEQQKILADRQQAATLAAIRARDSQPAQPLRTLPMGTVDQINSQDSALAQLNEIETLLSAPTAKSSMGGWPNVLGSGIANRLDGKGTPLRAAIANIGSLTYLDRSGAAVTPSEDERLAPLVPRDTDPADVALAKLQKLRAHIARERAGVADYYQQQGYAIPGSGPSGASQQSAPPPRGQPRPAYLDDPGFQDYLRQRGMGR
jgi:hypothetical protein